MALAPNTLTAELKPHGTFTATLADVVIAERATKRNLAHRIAEGYGGDGHGGELRGRFTRNTGHTYWLKFPKSVLIIVFCDMFRPSQYV